VYVSTDSFFSPRGKVLHGFDEFLAGLAHAQIPCIWITQSTRAQLDEPRRRLGQNHPYIGEGGSGVFLPEDYFHLKSRNTIRLGRYTCIPIARPQPAAAEALEQLASDLNISLVPLRQLSLRELSQNTGLPPKEAELMRMRDFDELFFFAGASGTEIAKFQAEAKARGTTVRPVGTFWSLSCGTSLTECVRELGALYDRAIRGHGLRIGVSVGPQTPDQFPSSGFDRHFCLLERVPQPPSQHLSEAQTTLGENGPAAPSGHSDRHHVHLLSAGVWKDLLGAVTAPR